MAWEGDDRRDTPQGSHNRLWPVARRNQRLCAADSCVNARCQELDTYLSNNFDALPDYGRRHRNGLAISSSCAEGCVDDIGNTRMAKRRRMRWFPRGCASRRCYKSCGSRWKTFRLADRSQTTNLCTLPHPSLASSGGTGCQWRLGVGFYLIVHMANHSLGLGIKIVGVRCRDGYLHVLTCP